MNQLVETSYLANYEAYLATAPIEDCFIMQVNGGGGHQNCFGVTLVGGTTCYVKPNNGTDLSATAVSNEVAAWEAGKLLGWPHLIAPTVLRSDVISPITHTATVSSLQVFWWNAIPAPAITSLSTTEVEQAGTLDYLIAHSDRPATANFLGVTSATTTAGGLVHLKLIDHGFAFDVPNRSPSSVFVDEVRGRELNAETVTAVEQFIVHVPLSRLPALLSPDAYTSMIDRAEKLVSARRFN